ncbi:tectonic-like complex member MKS1 [Salvelinus fontinalis]|uniref:tectonic-like complex member MKS1 n=1 Tax=Salvelinus fontinalis TaxID=8038 RepID=UPI0024855B7B|nr:tectonic-like complex member MKS1 [Salvelinus fontinalis]
MLSKTLQLRSVFRESPSQQPSLNTFSSRFLTQQERGGIELDTLNSQAQSAGDGEELVVGRQEKLFSQDSQSMVTQVKSNPTFLAHRMANVRHRRHDRHPVDSTVPKSRLITWEPSKDFMKISYVVNTPVQTMHIMGDLGPPGKLGQNEKECLLCTIRADGNGVITIKPDINKVVSSAKVISSLILFVTCRIQQV